MLSHGVTVKIKSDGIHTINVSCSQCYVSVYLFNSKATTTRWPLVGRWLTLQASLCPTDPWASSTVYLVCLCSQGWSWICHPPALASQALGLQAWDTIHGLGCSHFWYYSPTHRLSCSWDSIWQITYLITYLACPFLWLLGSHQDEQVVWTDAMPCLDI